MDPDFEARKQLLRKQAEARLARTTRPVDTLSVEEIKALIHDYQVHQIELELQNEELRQTQADLEESRVRYFELYDLAPVGYVTISESGLILEANLAASILLGMDRSALLKQPISRFIHKEDQDIYYLHRKKRFETGEPQECELRLVRLDGAVFWAHLAAAVARDTDGAPVCRVVINDITERKRASEILIQVQEEQFGNVFHESPIGIAVYTAQGMMRSMNKAFQAIYGIRDDRPIKGVSLYDDPYLSINARRSLLTGSTVREEVTFDCTHVVARKAYGTTKTGMLYLDVQITPFGLGSEGTVTGYMVQVQDISARKQAEEGQRVLSRQLILAHEDERRMISRELHDGVGQDLVTVKIGLDELGQRYPDASPGILEKIAAFSRLTGKAITDIRDLAYEQHPLGLEHFGFTQTIVQHVREFSDNTGIDLDLSLAGLDDLALGGDMDINLYRLIQEALRNIQKHAQAKHASIKVLKSFSNIILRIEDDGIGFVPVQRIASATREKRMGLRSMQERVKLLGGTMHIRSQPGKGTKVLVELPTEKEDA
ncbi:PAS domain-containing sensor histidine kinase [Desulfonatronum thioautotrophicum]|uniref:PAS domain-containing sensor histidine kinase n=1 Tax=Desulfonatronum thioautotrophicum TaxID=617001 RepID=UPI0006995ADC|nr:PAS domain S-box protein [Desulfonatronum thioautotrophicum]